MELFTNIRTVAKKFLSGRGRKCQRIVRANGLQCLKTCRSCLSDLPLRSSQANGLSRLEPADVFDAAPTKPMPHWRPNSSDGTCAVSLARGGFRCLHHPDLSLESAMADDKSIRGPADAARINVNEEHELRYWTKTLGVSEAKLRSAIAAAGVMAKDVRTYLGQPER